MKKKKIVYWTLKMDRIRDEHIIRFHEIEWHINIDEELRMLEILEIYYEIQEEDI